MWSQSLKHRYYFCYLVAFEVLQWHFHRLEIQGICPNQIYVQTEGPPWELQQSESETESEGLPRAILNANGLILETSPGVVISVVDNLMNEGSRYSLTSNGCLERFHRLTDAEVASWGALLNAETVRVLSLQRDLVALKKKAKRTKSKPRTRRHSTPALLV